MKHGDYQELLSLYALDGLEELESRAVTDHLDLCAGCRAELAQLRDTAALLAYAAPAAVPSDEVRQRILQEIRNQRRTQVDPATKPAPLRLPEQRAWPNVLRVAAAVALIILFLAALAFWRRDLALRRELDQLTVQVNQQQRELQLERDHVKRQSEALGLLNSPETKKMALAGTNTAPAARGTFLYNEATSRGMLMIEGLPATAADKAYEIWFIPKGLPPIPGQTFAISTEGPALVSDRFPAEAGTSAVIAVTLEPKSGSATPTGPIYVASPAS